MHIQNCCSLLLAHFKVIHPTSTSSYTISTPNMLSLHFLSWLHMTNRHSSVGRRDNLLIFLLRQTEERKDRQIDLHNADEMLS